MCDTNFCTTEQCLGVCIHLNVRKQFSANDKIFIICHVHGHMLLKFTMLQSALFSLYISAGFFCSSAQQFYSTFLIKYLIYTFCCIFWPTPLHLQVYYVDVAQHVTLTFCKNRNKTVVQIKKNKKNPKLIFNPLALELNAPSDLHQMEFKLGPPESSDKHDIQHFEHHSAHYIYNVGHWRVKDIQISVRCIT